MTRLYVVRHGRCAPGAAGHEADPGLDDTGRAQADRLATTLAGRLPQPVPILSSPLLRCRQTAAPLAAHWRADVQIEPDAIEFPSPANPALARMDWLRQALRATWAEASALGARWDPAFPARMQAWRRTLFDRLRARNEDAILVTHFVVINSLHGWCTGGDRLAGINPDHTSVTVFERRGDGLRLVELGRQADSAVI